MTISRISSHLALAGLALACVSAASANGGTSYEIFTDRAAFDARLGVAPRVIDFDDIDTTKTDPVPFGSKRYKFSHGATITGEDGQFAGTAFDVPSNIPPSSAPNEYAPGPVSDVLGGGGNLTDIHFFTGLRPALVAGVGMVFVDADFPGDGPSSLTVFDENDVQLATTGTVSGVDGSQLFRGIIAINDALNMPTPHIFRAHVVSGEGWAGNGDNETVALDDLCLSDPVGLGGLAGENCDNCVDDDGDGAIDRFDDECIPVAAGGGLGDPNPSKAVLKCQKSTEKAGTKFVNIKAKRLQKCLQTVAKCVQQKGNAPDCIAKATTKCDKELGKIPSDEAKLQSKVVKACDTLDPADRLDNDGLGYGAEIKPCASYVVGLDTAADIAACIVGDHECRVERLIGTVVPRAFEYLESVGRNPAVEFPCLPMGIDGAGDGLLDEKAAKAILKCDKELQKALLALLKDGAKATQGCADSAAKCQQLKPDDPKCLPKASAKCQKSIDKLLDPAKGKFAKILGKVLKKCGSTDLTFGDLNDGAGLGLSAAEARCTELEIDPGTPLGLLNCLGQDTLCEAVRMGEKQAPRLRQYSDVLDVELPEQLP